MNIRLITSILLTTGLLGLAIAAHAGDNGVPASEVQEWNEIYNPTTGSMWRTKTDTSTGETVSYNPFTSEIWRNPVTEQAEAVLREDWAEIDASAPSENPLAAITQAPASGDSAAPYSDTGAITGYPGTYLPEPSAKSAAQDSGSTSNQGANGASANAQGNSNSGGSQSSQDSGSTSNQAANGASANGQGNSNSGGSQSSQDSNSTDSSSDDGQQTPADSQPVIPPMNHSSYVW